MMRLVVMAMMLAVLAAAGVASAAPADKPEAVPRIWVEVEMAFGLGTARLELLDIVNGKFVFKNLEDHTFDLEQDDVIKVGIAGTGPEPPWKAESPKPPLQPPPPPVHRPVPPKPDAPAATDVSQADQERLKEALKALRPTPGMTLYVVSMRRAGRLDEAQARMTENAQSTLFLDVAMLNVGGLLLSWSLEALPYDQVKRNLKDVVFGMKNEDVKASAVEVLRYLEQRPEVLQNVLKEPGRGLVERLRPGFIEKRVPRRPEGDERRKRGDEP